MKDEKRRPEDDPRYQRVRANLFDAALKLSATKTVDEVTVAELTALAGVHRTSFYSHASSPPALLLDLLKEELEESLLSLKQKLAEGDLEFERYWHEFYCTVLEHVESRRDIYSQAVAANSVVLVGLYDFFAGSVSESLEIMMESWDPADWTLLRVEMARQQQAHNLMAVVAAWVATDLAAPIDEVVEEYWALAPPWQLAKKGPDGMVKMRRRGSPSKR